MLLVDGCVSEVIHIEEIEYASIRYGEGTWAKDLDPTRRCHDCNAAWGNFHHPGCDMEECPKCHGQLISCGCLDDED